MTPAPPSRRGRPPGARNRPKPTLPPSAEMLVPVIGDTSDLIEGVLRHTHLPVVLRRKRAIGQADDEADVEWPSDWRLPQQGEMVFLSGQYGGMVQYVEFRLDRRVIVVCLR